MPRRDQTGPLGSGSMTGRGLGLCNNDENNNVNNPSGRGLGRGDGMGRRSGGGFKQGQRFESRSNDSSLIEKLTADIDGLKEDMKKLLSRLSS